MFLILRAIQTAEIIATRMNISYLIEDALREYDMGIFEGRSDEASWRKYWELFNSWMDRQNWNEGISG